MKTKITHLLSFIIKTACIVWTLYGEYHFTVARFIADPKILGPAIGIIVFMMLSASKDLAHFFAHERQP